MSGGPRLDGERLSRALAAEAGVGRVVVRSSVGSTNDLAWELAARGAGSWTVVAADEQTAGRGRHGRAWHSRAGLGLYASVVVRPWSGHRAPGRWTLAAAVAAAEACRSAGVRAAVEWPNDVVADGRKLAGVLAESRSAGNLADVFVLGVGCNVHHRAEDLPGGLSRPATSMAIESNGTACDRERLAVDWVVRLVELFRALGRDEWSEVVRRWDGVAAGARGLRVRVENGVRGPGRSFEGVTCGLDARGLLRVRRADGEVRSVHAAASVRPMEDRPC